MNEALITSRVDAARYRITFAKTIEMRYTSHLDLQRAWERMLRRSGLPVLYTGGFHPRARFNLASPLPLGFTGAAEMAEVYLTRPVSPGAVADALARTAPPGIRMSEVQQVRPTEPAIQTHLDKAEYTVVLPGDSDLNVLRGRVNAMRAADSIVRQRRGKTYDLRPLIEDIRVVEPGECVGPMAGMLPDGAVLRGPGLRLRLSQREGATGRPDEVLLALGLDPLTTQVCRTRILLRD